MKGLGNDFPGSTAIGDDTLQIADPPISLKERLERIAQWIPGGPGPQHLINAASEHHIPDK